MKSKIEAVFDARKFGYVSFSDKELHVVDYTERTTSARSVEVHNVKPVDIDSLTIFNPTEIDISTSIFKPQCFIGADGKEPKQCECVMSPTILTKDAWILFIEIKDCKPKNVSNYHKEVKEKIIANVQLFRDKNILDENKVVYAVISFPRKEKTNYHNHLIKASEWKRFRDDYKIMIKGTNEVRVKNEKNIL
jgi:hypothetical protein